MSASAEAARRSVDDVLRSLLVASPYFGHLVVGLPRLIVDGERDAGWVARLGVAGHIARLEIHLAGWAACSSDDARRRAIEHELVHLTLKHPLRARGFAIRPLYGVACDLVVGSLLGRGPEDALTLADFADWRLPEGATADAYYALLLAGVERATSSGCETDAPMLAIARWLETHAAAHEGWQDFAALASPALSVVEANVDALIRATASRLRRRGWGDVPAALRTHLDMELASKSEIPWRRVLRLFRASSERTFLKNTLRRPSKRYGTTPGVRVRRRTAIVVVLDTSASIGADELATFFGEVHVMWRAGAVVTVIECDAAVVREYPYRGIIPSTVSGGGGTSFDPGLRRANELMPDALLYFTDGEGPEPEVPARVPLLWILTARGRSLAEAEHLPGRRVKLSSA